MSRLCFGWCRRRDSSTHNVWSYNLKNYAPAPSSEIEAKHKHAQVPPKPELGNRHQQERESNSVPVPANIPQTSESSSTSAFVPDSQSKHLKREGLTQLLGPGKGADFATTYDIDVVAIHGLNGHPLDTWTYKKPEGQVFWLQDLLPKALPGARIFTYGYDSRTFFSPSTGNIGSYAKGLLDDLNLERRSPAETSRPIVFICHSLGGLVCKKSLIIANEKRERYRCILDSTKAIFFFGTPHQGSDFADTALQSSPILKLFDSGAVEFIGGKGKLVRTELIQELSAKSETLDDLCSAFVERAHQVHHITTFYEVNKFRGSVIVSKRSATIGVANENVVGLAGDHRQICRIKDEDEKAYRMIVQYCQELGTDCSEGSKLLSSDEQECLKSLALLSIGEPFSTRTSPAKNTCEWILSVPQFNTWRNGLPPLLWISGELGSGKTTLLSFLQRQMLEPGVLVDKTRAKRAKRSTVCSFFCDARNKDFANATVILRGLVWDIVSQRHDLIHHALKSFQSSRPWSYDELWRILQAILDDPRARGACIIIDALDECNRKERNFLLKDIAIYLGKRSKARCHPINIVVSSRPSTIGASPELKEYSSYFMLSQDIVLREHVVADIQRFVLEDLLSDGQFSSRDDPDSIVQLTVLANTIATKSEGSFLWASLVLEELHTRSFIKPRDIEVFISECPSTLRDIYYESLAKVKHEYRKTVVKSLRIIVAARRPLTIAEFRSALAVERGHQTLEQVQQTINKDLERITSYLRDVLSSLICTDGSTITLRHQSVKDFLVNRLSSTQDSSEQHPLEHSSDLCDVFGMSMNDAESTLAECCMSFLKLEDFDQKRSDIDVERETWELSGLGNISISTEPTPESPISISHDYDHIYFEPRTQFFKYAASTWGFHYSASESANVDLRTDALTLSTRTNTLSNWSYQFKKSYQGREELPESVNPLIVAAYFGHTFIVETLLSNNDFGSSLDAALIQASRMGHLGIVNQLIEHDIPNIMEMYDGASAFSWATAGGFLPIVDALLAYNKDLVNVTNGNGTCPLSLAVSYQHLEVVHKLLGTENIDVNLMNDQRQTSIFFTFSLHDLSAVEEDIFLMLLRDLRVIFTVRDKHGRSFLSYAAERGVTKAIQILLNCRDRRAEIGRLLDDVGDNRGISPLSYAAWWGHVDAVRLLCETKQIDSQLWSVNELDGDNAFHLAAKSGHVQVIKELVKHHPDGVNSRCLAGRTPLSVAMWEHNPEVLRALLDGGADVNLPDFQGRPPISYGADKDELVKVLVEEYGAHINIRDSNGLTPLGYAMRGDESSGAYLKKLGAQL